MSPAAPGRSRRRVEPVGPFVLVGGVALVIRIPVDTVVPVARVGGVGPVVGVRVGSVAPVVRVEHVAHVARGVGIVDDSCLAYVVFVAAGAATTATPNDVSSRAPYPPDLDVGASDTYTALAVRRPAAIVVALSDWVEVRAASAMGA